jgi:WD40 repeat protein
MLWDLASGTLATEFGGYSSKLLTAKLSETGDVMLTADDYNDVIKIWDYRKGRLKKTIDRDTSSLMSSATISSDGRLMATGGWNGRTSNAIIWDIAASKQIARMELAKESGSHTEALHITDDGKYLIWAARGYITISDLRSGKEVKTIEDSSQYPKEWIVVDKKNRYIIYPSGFATELLSYPEGEPVKVSSEGTVWRCVIGKECFYEFATIRDERGEEQYLTVVDLRTLKKVRRKAKYPGFSKGVEYNEDVLFLASGNDIVKYDLKKCKKTAIFTGHKNYITNIETTPDGKFLSTSSADGTTRLWDIETGREAAQFISFSDGEWIVITPEGYFNASPSGAKYLNVRVGNKVYSVDNFYEKFYNPAYVASVLQGGAAVAAADIRKGILAPPEVRITSPEAGKVYSSDAAAITVSAKDMGGGIDEIRLYHNGKAIGEETRGIKIVSHETGSAKTYNVTLVDGPNTFRAIGFSKDRTESNPDEVTVTLTAPKKDISLYVLAAGINTYKNPALSLNYAEPDARGIADFFKKKGQGLFKQAYVTDIYNEQVTKAEIISQLTQLQKTNPQDVVLIYLAGHGENINDRWYFIPYELTYPERESEVKAKAVSSVELSKYIKNIKAQKILVLIDACKAGAVLVAFRGFEDRKALSQLSRSTGVHIVAASTKSQFAAEVKELGHGVFTYTLLEGLSGKAVGKGETVTVRKLLGYIEEQLPEITKKYQQEAQYPVVDSRGMDFPLVISK